jgi:hypothetical protein
VSKYEIPDATTPWRSQAEQLSALQERDAQGRKRYETDSAFRQACEAKAGLGFDNPDEGPQLRIPTGAMSSAKDLGRFASISGAEMDKIHEVVTLQTEVKALEHQLEQHNNELQGAQQIEALRSSVEGIRKGAAPQPFESKEEAVRAMSSPRYENDPEFRAAVEARAVLGIPGVTTKQGEGAQRHQE